MKANKPLLRLCEDRNAPPHYHAIVLDEDSAKLMEFMVYQLTFPTLEDAAISFADEMANAFGIDYHLETGRDVEPFTGREFGHGPNLN
jgi:hypothetical protein